MNKQDYLLGQSQRAARRLEIQDEHFATVSERLLDRLALRPGDRVVELGCGPGSFSRRILKRLGKDGVLVGVDSSKGLLDQASAALVRSEGPRFESVLANLADLGPWLDGADVVAGRAVLHHVPMAEFVLGRLRSALKAGTRLGFLEPDFRSPLARLAHWEASHPQISPLLVWAVAINKLYQASHISPAVGSTLARALEMAGYRGVQGDWTEFQTDAGTIENMVMFYDEVRDRLQSFGIMTPGQVEEQQRLLQAMPTAGLPGAWGMFSVVCHV
jgi:ubiquinone/menaquinone biosynthesis C-methylase UbiE